MQDITGKVILVTGANRGIGAAIVQHLHAAGAQVVATARRVESLAASAAAGIACEALDVCEEVSVQAAFAAVQARFGRLDGLVNNAGVGRYGKLVDFSLADFDVVLNTNLRGAFACAREAMRVMVPQGAGTIVNIASAVGVKGYAEQAAYTASKHGVMGLTKSLAVEAQPLGIRVSVVLPGGVDTEMVREARPDLDPAELIQPGDIAEAVHYLLALPDSCAIDQIYVRRRSSSPF